MANLNQPNNVTSHNTQTTDPSILQNLPEPFKSAALSLEDMDVSDGWKALLIEQIDILSERKKLLDMQKRVTWELEKQLEALDECIAELDKAPEEAAELRDAFAKHREALAKLCAQAVGKANLEAVQFEVRCLDLKSEGIDLEEFGGFEDGEDAAADGCASLLLNDL